MRPVDTVLSRFPNARRTGSGWLTNCPAHEDRRPSLSISEGEDGKVLLHCFAGCSLDAILAGAEIDKASLFPDGKVRRKPAAWENFKGKPIVARYPYCDETGKVLFYVCRTADKEFPQWNPAGGGWGLNGSRRVLYRLPDLVNADKSEWVFFCEGEKDADRLASLDLLSTTCPCGAGKWRPEYAGTLAGRQVAILEDNDTAGQAGSKKIADALRGIAAEVKIIRLPGLPNHGDVSDWLDAGGTVERLLSIVEGKMRARLVRLSSVDRLAIQWLWANRIPLGMFSMLVGDPGIGKTFFLAYVIALVTRGLPWPDCPGESNPPGSVILLNDEDDFAHVVGPRLDAHGADCSKVFGLDGLELPGGDRIEVFNISNPEHLQALEGAIKSRGDCRLVVFDPVTAYLGKTNANSNADVRSALTGLAKLAQRQTVAVIGVSHLSKKSDLDAIYRVLGSMGFAAQARAVWGVVWDKENEGVRLLQPVKTNLSVNATGLAFSIEGGRVVFQDRVVRETIDESLRNPPEKKAEAMEWLETRLQNKATVAATVIHDEADKAGIASGTLRRAADELNVKKEQVWAEKRCQGWFWSLP